MSREHDTSVLRVHFASRSEPARKLLPFLKSSARQERSPAVPPPRGPLIFPRDPHYPVVLNRGHVSPWGHVAMSQGVHEIISKCVK